MRKLLTTCAILTGLTLSVTACQTTSKMVMNPPSTKMEPAEMPASFKVGDKIAVKSVKSGNKQDLEIVDSGADFYVFQPVGQTCKTTKSKSIDFYAPIAASDCSFGSITREISDVDGTLWPLQVGNSVSFNVKISFKSVSNHPAKCKVTEQGNISLPYGNDDVYKVVCKDDIHIITSYYSPAKQAIVKYRFERPQRNRVYFDQETVSITRS